MELITDSEQYGHNTVCVARLHRTPSSVSFRVFPNSDSVSQRIFRQTSTVQLRSSTAENRVYRRPPLLEMKMWT
jgi:hypothetical protein